MPLDKTYELGIGELLSFDNENHKRIIFALFCESGNKTGCEEDGMGIIVTSAHVNPYSTSYPWQYVFKGVVMAWKKTLYQLKFLNLIGDLLNSNNNILPFQNQQ